MAATPAWLRMPMPITEILATSAELCTSNSPMSFLAAFSASSVRGSSVACTVKVMSVCLPSGVTLCTIMSTLMLASASGPKMRAATPGLSSTLMSVTFASSLT